MPRPKRSRVASTRTKNPAPVADVPNPDVNNMVEYDGDSVATNAQQITVLAGARKRRDSAMERLENMTSTADSAVEETADSSTSSIELGRRAGAATPLQAGRGRLADVSGLDLDDEIFDDLNTTFDSAGPSSVHRSYDTSTLSAGQFKRRPRAGSFLSSDHGPIRPSSRAGPNTPGFSSTFNIGLFKRRAREPSILGTLQKPKTHRPESRGETEDEQEDLEAEASAEEEDQPEDNELVPEINPTPPRRVTRGSVAARNAPAETVAANPRKRKSMENHESRARSSPYGNDTAARVPESEAASLPSSPPTLNSRPRTPFMDDELLAPPASSDSSDNEADIWPPLQSLAKARNKRPAAAVIRKTPPRDYVSDMSSPPSLTHSPNYRSPTPPPRRGQRLQTRAVSKQTKKITTAALTEMLPRRRHRVVRDDPFDLDGSDAEEVDTSGPANNNDELTSANVRTRRRAARPLSRSGAANSSAAPSKSTSRPKRASRTYGRSSDKENQEEEETGEGDSLWPAEEDEEEDDEASELMLAKMSAELRKAKEKFEEVDKWEMEFEEAPECSSPKDAR